MPIIISRTGLVESKGVKLLTPEQKHAAWEYIVRTWVDKHPDRLRELINAEPAKTETE